MNQYDQNITSPDKDPDKDAVLFKTQNNFFDTLLENSPNKNNEKNQDHGHKNSESLYLESASPMKREDNNSIVSPSPFLKIDPSKFMQNNQFDLKNINSPQLSPELILASPVKFEGIK